MVSGKRVSNTLAIYPLLGDNLAKARLIPHDLGRLIRLRKASAVGEEPMVYQLVGEVMAHQGDDG